MTNIQITKEQTSNAVAAWRSVREHDAASHIIYNMMRGLDPMRGFSPCNNPRRMKANDPQWAFKMACQAIRSYRRCLATSDSASPYQLRWRDQARDYCKRLGIEPSVLEALGGTL